jgi:membrane protein DedA with SNARE-associated domain
MHGFLAFFLMICALCIGLVLGDVIKTDMVVCQDKLNVIVATVVLMLTLYFMVYFFKKYRSAHRKVGV